jgi:aspartate/glutamate racemase
MNYLIIGGLSYVSSQAMYGLLHRLDSEAIVDILDFKLTEAVASQYRIEEQIMFRLGEIKNIDKYHAISLCCNSAHVCYQKIKAAYPNFIPIMRVLELVDSDSVLVLGTDFTIENDIYGKFCGSDNLDIEVSYLPANLQSIVHAMIYDYLIFNKVPENVIEITSEIKSYCFERGIASIILGCTELCLIRDHLEPFCMIDSLDGLASILTR